MGADDGAADRQGEQHEGHAEQHEEHRQQQRRRERRPADRGEQLVDAEADDDPDRDGGDQDPRTRALHEDLGSS